jgi:hypothetical protein
MFNDWLIGNTANVRLLYGNYGTNEKHQVTADCYTRTTDFCTINGSCDTVPLITSNSAVISLRIRNMESL